jgi:CubicO group peptidase (beta-lactamase class C family)
VKTVVLICAFCLVLFAVAVRPVASAEAPSMSHCNRSQVAAQVETLLAAQAAKHSIGGMTVGVVCGPDLVWTKSYGYADMERGKLATQDTVYRIGSITKQFTGLMLLQLVEHGKVKLSSTVRTYFPDVDNIEGSAALSQPISLHELATHRSGLSREPDDKIFLTGVLTEWENITRSALPHVKYQFEPGAHFSYSNIGYAILGAALSNAAAQPYTEYVQQHILAPLHMSRTSFEPNGQMLRELAKGYVVVQGNGDPTIAARELQTGRGYKVPNGGLFTTIGDLAKFVSFEMGAGRQNILKPATLKDNFTHAYPTNQASHVSYGVGFQMWRKDHQTVIGHGGVVAGYTAGAYFDPDTQVGVVYLRSSLDNENDDDAVFHVLSLLANTHK